MSGESKEMTDAISSSPELLKMMNDLRWEFPESRLLWVQVGEREWGENPKAEFSVDLLAELANNEKQRRQEKEWKESRKEEVYQSNRRKSRKGK